MATTLNNNYSKNIDILKENLKRGMSEQQANNAINNMQNSFLMARLYDESAQQFITTMRKIVKEHFTTTVSATDIMATLGVETVNIN